MNQAIHMTAGQMPFTLSRHQPRVVGTALPTVEGAEEEMAEAYAQNCLSRTTISTLNVLITEILAKICPPIPHNFTQAELLA